MVKPKFVKAIAKDGEIIQEFPTEIVNPKICSDTTLTMIQGILRKVVSEGLAKPAGSKQFSVSGKTGTAQVSRETWAVPVFPDTLNCLLPAGLASPSETTLRRIP